MNKKGFTILIALLLTISSFAQAPEKISYQAVVRGASNAAVASQVVGMQISVLQTTATGTAVYVETQMPTTNANGLLSIYIGAGTPATGTFAGIDWSAGPYFIKTEIDPVGGSSYTITGTSQLLSVPYALHTKQAANGLPSGGTDGQVLAINASGTPEWTNPSTGQTYYEDADDDGYGNINSAVIANVAPNGYVDNNTDCDDNDPAINPTTIWYIGVDTDGDNFFGSTTSLTQCESPGAGYTLTEPTTPDCDDGDGTINPNTVWYIGVDADNDTYMGSVTAVTQCVSPGVDYTLTAPVIEDCNDGDPSINPLTVWYADIDGDGFGDINTSETGCTSTLANATQDNTDCDDGDDTINQNTVWYVDVDGDGFGDINTSETGCTPTLVNATKDNTDCDDSIATGSNINPGVIEILGDGIDNDCDGKIDEIPAVIGDLIEGGIVFWVDPSDNTKGKVCALANAPTTLNWNSAQSYCNGYTNPDTGTGVYSNWYLPSKDELQIIYTNLQRFGCSTNTPGGYDSTLCPTAKANFSLDYYYSSTEYDISTAWLQDFTKGNQNTLYKFLPFSVRAVRAF